MNKRNKKSVIVLVLCLVIAFVSMGLANLLQTNFGKVDVVTASFAVEDNGESYSITYKMYIPKEASAENPLPAVLCLHGYQNDRETSAAYAIELARRGIVAVCIDEFGHGYNERSMKERGWTTYKVQGQSEDASETVIKTNISGPKRFLTMMNFSTLSFFEGDAYSVNEEKYVHIDADADGIKDSSMGGIAAFRWMQTQPFIQADNIGITGHSMGTWASWTTAAACQDHVAVVLQCGEVFGENMYDSSSVEFHNVLMLQARYDEFNYFRDYRQETVSDDMLTSGIRNSFFTAAGKTAASDSYHFNELYGNFADGTARQVTLLETNHRLTTHDGNGIAAAMDWFVTALEVRTDLSSHNQIYLYKEVLVMIAMLAVMAALCPAVLLLTNLPVFRGVVQDRSASAREPRLMSKKQWWINALISVLLGGITYPFMTQLGHGLFPLPEGIFRMTIGNGFLIWYMTLALITIAMTVVSRIRNKKKNIANLDFYDLGLSGEDHADKLDWGLLGRSFLLSVIVVTGMYLLVLLFQALFRLDLRFIWPFFKGFTGERFLQFLVYLPFYALFFIVNVGYKLFGQMRQRKDYSHPVKNFMKCWLGNIVVLLGGLFLVLLVEYIPFFLGFGPGADLLFSTTFGGPFMSALILLVPQFIVFTFLSTWFERKSGNVYVGAFVSAMLAAWIVTGGSAMF